MLMNLSTLNWDDSMLSSFGLPRACLPTIKSSSEVYGTCVGILSGVPVAGILGDQQAALFGQTCFDAGDAKCTYGTGQFLMLNTGTTPMTSTNGLLTTVGYKIGDAPTVYALEGAVAYCGSLIQWLRDNLKILNDAKESETMANRAGDNGGLYVVPAFAGLFAPHWDSTARGCIVGMTAYNTSDHVARASLEAAAYQAKDVIDAMYKDSGVQLKALQVDGGMTANKMLMQFQADVLNTPVSRPVIPETTALGAAYAAGLAVGVWKNTDELKKHWKLDKRWESSMASDVREKYLTEWNRAVEKSKGWVVDDANGKSAKKLCIKKGMFCKRSLSVGILSLAVGIGLGWVAANKGKR
jgi:glycerol kinase